MLKEVGQAELRVQLSRGKKIGGMLFIVSFPDPTRAHTEKGLVKFAQEHLNSEEFPRAESDWLMGLMVCAIWKLSFLCFEQCSMYGQL